MVGKNERWKVYRKKRSNDHVKVERLNLGLEQLKDLPEITKFGFHLSESKNDF